MLWFLKKKNIKYIIISAAVFFASWAFCYFGIGALFSGGIEATDINGLYSGENAFMLFLNNFAHCLICVIGCGILSVPMVIIDGASIGIAGVAFKLFGGKFSQYFLMLLPHCIFEIPALLIACAGGLRLFSLLRKYISGDKSDCKQEIIKILKSGIIILILTVLAAVTEAYITPVIAKSLGG